MHTLFMLYLQLQNQQAKVQAKFCNVNCTLYLFQYIVHQPQPEGVHQPQLAGVHQSMSVDNRNPSVITDDGMLIKLLPDCSYIGTETGRGWGATAPPIFCYVLRSLQLSKTDI